MSEKINELLKGLGNSTYIIAEIGSNFNGNLNLAKESIDAAVECGADAVKFQTFKADEFVADKNLTYTYKNSKGEDITETQYEMFKRLELKDEWHIELLRYSRSKNVDFLSSAADKNAADLLIEINSPIIKLASEDLINIELLDYVAAKRCPVILSTGMADEFEIDNAIKIFESHNSRDIMIMHCVSLYPTPAKYAGLNRISALRKKYPYIIGYSDHTEGWEAPMLSVAYGSRILEKHFTLDKNLPGPDHKMAADPTDFNKMVEMVRLAEKMGGLESLNYQISEEVGRKEFRRSIVAKNDLPMGKKIELGDLAYKRPGGGLKPYERDKILGRKLNVSLKVNEMVLLENLE
jgi:sialic acid synthase SpsE